MSYATMLKILYKGDMLFGCDH